MQGEKPNYSNKTIYMNSVCSLIFRFGSALVSFMTAPLLLSILGETEYGAWVALLSLISWVYYCDVGIGSSMRNKIATAIAEDDYPKARKFVGVSYATISLISAALFIVFICISKVIDICGFFEIEIAGKNLNLTLTIAVFYACINFVISLANNVLYAVQRSASVGFFGSLAQLFFWIALLIFAFTGIKSILIIAVAEGSCQLLKNIIETFYVYHKYPELKFSWKEIEWSYSREIMTLGLMMFVSQIAALILNTTDNLVISKCLTLAQVTPYSFCYKYFNMINTVYVALITPLLSAYTMAYAKRDIRWIKATIKKNALLYGLFLIGSVVAMFLFEDFARLWLGKELFYGSGLVAATWGYFALLMFSHISSTMLTGFGKIKELTVAVIIGTALNIPVSIFLATRLNLGTTGVILGSILSLVPSSISAPIVARRALKEIKQKE